MIVRWKNKKWAVLQTYGLFNGRVYQVYKRIDDTDDYARQPVGKSNIIMFKTIKSAKEYIKSKGVDKE